ncbi:hypothetical protein D3C76_1764700 [compost metagenome]
MASVRHRDIDALLQPGRIGWRILQLTEFIDKYLRCLLTTTVRQQTIERQLGKLTTFDR